MTGASVRPVKPARLRCAPYTRKSSEEGLDQAFNSLHAQREACEAFVLSQAGEGWRAITTGYDDGGFSGGSMERPALKHPLADIAAGRIDVIVVYKIDRLTRSLADFDRIVELFDAHKVSFVSVTQSWRAGTGLSLLRLGTTATRAARGSVQRFGKQPCDPTGFGSRARGQARRHNAADAHPRQRGSPGRYSARRGLAALRDQ